MTDKLHSPYVVVGPDGVKWLGLVEDESAAWQIFLGWPDDEEVKAAKARGLYAARAELTWKQPK